MLSRFSRPVLAGGDEECEEVFVRLRMWARLALIARGWRIVAGGVTMGCALGLGSWALGQEDPDFERLAFDFERPHTVTIYPTEGGESYRSGRVFWYLPYTLTNEGKAKAKFFVSVSA